MIVILVDEMLPLALNELYCSLYHCRSHSSLSAIQHMLVVGEMLVLSLFARCLYHKPHAAFQLDKMDKADKEGSSPGDLPNGVAAVAGDGGAGVERVVIHSDDLVRPVDQERYRSLSNSAMETWADSGTDNRGYC